MEQQICPIQIGLLHRGFFLILLHRGFLFNYTLGLFKQDLLHNRGFLPNLLQGEGEAQCLFSFQLGFLGGKDICFGASLAVRLICIDLKGDLGAESRQTQ